MPTKNGKPAPYYSMYLTNPEVQLKIIHDLKTKHHVRIQPLLREGFRKELKKYKDLYPDVINF